MEQKGKEKWDLLEHFKTPDGNTRDWYGHAVAIEDDIAVVSAYEHGGEENRLQAVRSAKVRDWCMSTSVKAAKDLERWQN